ncbi:MAG: hypothetical protein KGO53_12760 [Alphaproteobacteria bacterium]|nr:hypothetical protein [Alphaproteobacteria bacterium]
MNRTFKISLAGLLALGTLAATADSSFAASRRAYCRAQAAHAARHVGGDQVVTGLALGAATGGVIGAITGHGAGSNIATGLAIGGVGGTMAGAVAGSEKKRQVYWEVYHQCMGDY